MKPLLARLTLYKQQAQQQLADNPRLGWGLLVIAVIVLWYINLVLNDHRQQLKQEIQALQLREQDVQAVLNQQQWPQRLSAVHNKLQQQSEYFGHASSEALARADIQASLAELIKQHHLAQPRIEVSVAPAVDDTLQLIPLQVHIRGKGDGNAMLALLGALETNRPYYAINEISLTQSPQRKELNLSLFATVWYHPWEDPS